MPLLRDEPSQADLVSSELVYQGRVWGIRRDVVRYGDPGNGRGDRASDRGADQETVREYVDHTGAVAVLALDERGRVLLIQQYRHPVRQRDWELPAGLLDTAGESPLQTAQRELAEEADLVAEDWAVLAELLTSPGGSSEMVRVYLARGLSPMDEPFARVDEEAELKLCWAPLEEIIDAVLERRIRNGILGYAVLAAREARDRGWRTLGDPEQPWADLG